MNAATIWNMFVLASILAMLVTALIALRRHNRQHPTQRAPRPSRRNKRTHQRERGPRDW